MPYTNGAANAKKAEALEAAVDDGRLLVGHVRARKNTFKTLDIDHRLIGVFAMLRGAVRAYGGAP
jgi:hypothetical protein